jgi:small-conductance mechanosensitive channel
VPVLLISGIYAVGRLADGMGRFLARRTLEAAAAIVRLVATGVGYLLVLIAVFELLGVSLAHLIIGFGLAGVVLGIAAQQSLGNIFASLVLLFARPFSVGEHIRVRSGTIGVVDAWVLGIGLTYVTLQTEDGILKVPNSVVLASGIGKLDMPPQRLP